MNIQEEIDKQTASLSSKTDDLWGLFTGGVKSYIDKETRADDTSAPGAEDIVYAGGTATPINQQGQSMGMSPATIAMMLGGLVVVAVVLKKVL